MTKRQKNNDAFGQLLLSWLKGGNDPEIVERDDGYIDASKNFGKATYFASATRWHWIERRAMREVRGRVLDIGCGAGRHALELQKRGHIVTGIDISPGAVRVSRARGVRDARKLSIDGVARLRPLRFDTIIMMGNNFGLFGSVPKAKRLLKAFHTITTPRARIVAQVRDPGQTTNPYHRAYHQWNRSRGRLPGQLRIRVRYKNHVGAWMNYLFVAKKEVAPLLGGTDWRLAKIIGNDPYIAIIEKEKN